MFSFSFCVCVYVCTRDAADVTPAQLDAISWGVITRHGFQVKEKQKRRGFLLRSVQPLKNREGCS